MPITTVTITVPNPEQPLTELTRAEAQQAFLDLAAVVSRLETRRRALFRRLQAAEQRAAARRILTNLSPEEIQALRAELEATP
jgi:hypothetical protein